MSTATAALPTASEYLAAEREAEERHEFMAGEIWAMSGASLRHGQIVWNLVEALGPRLRASGCRGYANDLRVRVPLCDAYFYPDLVVVCGEPQVEDGENPDTLLNPRLLVEVLSPSTEDVDRGRKSACYRSLPTLEAYVVLAQDRPWAEVLLRRDASSWLLHEIDGGTDPDAALEIPFLDLALPLADLYRE
ncbi:MAG: Uma2 family endonuclease [Acidobacteriota bacterium]